jgi:hypothetical protein
MSWIGSNSKGKKNKKQIKIKTKKNQDGSGWINKLLGKSQSVKLVTPSNLPVPNNRPTLATLATLEQINFKNLYEEQVEKVSQSMNTLNPSTTDFTQEFIIENFKLEILCIFAVLYQNIIQINMDKTNLQTHFTKFKQLMNTAQSRVKILLYLNGILPKQVDESKPDLTQEFSTENFKSEIFCIFTLLYPNIIHDIDKNNLIKEFKQFNYYMYNKNSRESVLEYVDKLKNQELSGGMKCTRKVKRTKSKRTKHCK